MSYLEAFGLPQQPFSPQPLRRQQPQMPQFEQPRPTQPLQIDPPSDFAQIDGLMRQLRGQDKGKDPMEAIRAILRRIPRTPDVWSEQPEPQATAMTPITGPDTGAPNPNAGDVPAGYFSRIRKPEGTASNPRARNDVTGAAGMFQFLPTTYADIRREAPHLGLTDDVYDETNQQRAMDYYTRKSMALLQPYLKRQPTMGELYALHFLGHSGGMNLLRNLDAPFESLVSPAVITSNPWTAAYAKKPARALLRQLEVMMGE